jgi:oligopeptide/dipeptide ABC transporter ATP-binding protein
VVAEVASRVVVMYAGRVVEECEVHEIFKDPLHPYTWGLLGSVPRIDKSRPDRLPTIQGSPPSLLRPPSGCPFKTRCPHRFADCDSEPELRPLQPNSAHRDRCHLSLKDKRRLRIVDGGIGLPVPTERDAS